MGQGGANEVILVEYCAMLNLILKIHQDGVLDKLSLQEALLIDRAVKESLITEIPEEVHGIVLDEEVF